MNRKASRSGLFLLELIMSILFFSIAGAVCVRLFVNSHILSQRSVELNHALEWSQNIAELFYGCNGNPEQMLDGISRIYSFDGVNTLPMEPSEDKTALYPAGFQLFFDSDFEPLDTIASSGYVTNVNLSEKDGLISCNICTQKLPASGAGASADPIYQLDITLFPAKEDSHGN